VATEIENRENADNALRVVQIVLRHRGRNRTSRSHRNQRFYSVCSLRRPRDDAYRISTRTETSNRYQVTSPTLHSLVRIRFNPNRRMHSSHNTMPDESAISGSVLYPQEICSKRSSDIGFGSRVRTTKYNVTGTSRAPQPWMLILVVSKGRILLSAEYYAVAKIHVKQKCPAVVKRLKIVRFRTVRQPQNFLTVANRQSTSELACFRFSPRN